jgi:predicted small secreted protein
MMHKLRTAVALVVSLALAGCQTLDGVTVNGKDINQEYKEAQAANTGVPAWVWVAGAVAAGVLIWVLVDDDDDD